MGVKINVLKAVACKLEENIQLINVLPDLESLKKAMIRYLTNTTLQGEAYDSHKDYIECLQMPVVNGIITLCEELKSANVKYGAIISSYFPAGNIDQDFWEATLEQLMNRQSELIGMITNTVADKMAATTVQQDDSYENTVNCLMLQKKTVETMIYYYQGKLKKLAEMNNALSNVYYTANYLRESVTAAVNLLNSIQVGTDGNYIMDDVDWSVIEELENSLLAEQILDEIKDKLGEDTYNAFINGELSDEDSSEFMQDCMAIISAHVGEFKGVIGHYEIYLSPNLSVYIENSVTSEIDGYSPFEYETELGNDFDCAISCTASIGNFEFEYSEDGGGLQYTEQVDENSEYYAELSFEPSQISLECGLNSVLLNAEEQGEIETNVAIGLEVHLATETQSTQWQNEPVSELAYADIPQLEEEVEAQLVATVVQDVVADLEEVIAENPNADILMDAALVGMDLALCYASIVEPTPYIHIPKEAIEFIGNLIKYGVECFAY